MAAPRISVNKLGEYLTTASPVRRRSIVRDQKIKNGAAAPRYRLATAPIETFLDGGGTDVEVIVKAIESLRKSVPDTEWGESDHRNTADALEVFLEVSDALPMDGITYLRGDSNPPKLPIAGVDVSVRPDFLLHFERRGKSCIGALKIHYIRDNEKALKESGQQYVAALCHRWLSAYGPRGCTPIHTHCFSLDLFRKRLIHAPASFTKRMRAVELACSDIALVWPTLY